MSETSQDALSKLRLRDDQLTEVERRAEERRAARAKAALAASALSSASSDAEADSVTELTQKPAILDQGLPYGMLCGGGPVYEQNGKLFNQLGYQIDSQGNMLDKSIVLTGDEPRVGQYAPIETDVDGIVSYQRMTASQLKAVLESYGEEYTTREAAVALLEGLNTA